MRECKEIGSSRIAYQAAHWPPYSAYSLHKYWHLNAQDTACLAPDMHFQCGSLAETLYSHAGQQRSDWYLARCLSGGRRRALWQVMEASQTEATGFTIGSAIVITARADHDRSCGAGFRRTLMKISNFSLNFSGREAST